MTELTSNNQSDNKLLSQTVITDGNWHHIGLTWDGLSRTLYVDGVAVAEDALNNLYASRYRYHLGTGKNMEAGTFFSGLIDDIRIYNQALTSEEISALAQ